MPGVLRNTNMMKTIRISHNTPAMNRALFRRAGTLRITNMAKTIRISHKAPTMNCDTFSPPSSPYASST
jgi:hypothetical protein